MIGLKPPDCNCHCRCCPEPLELDRWVGARALSPDLTSYPGWYAQNPANGGLLWAVCCVGTGDLTSGTPFCLRQGDQIVQCTLIAPQTFGVCKAADLSCVPNQACLMPLAMGQVVDGHMDVTETNVFRREVKLGMPGTAPNGPDPCGDTQSTVLQLGYAAALGNSCPMSITTAGGGNVLFGITQANLEYVLMIVCQCCEADSEWWGFNEKAGASIPGYQPSSGDLLRSGASRCVGGLMTPQRGPCDSNVGIFDAGPASQCDADIPNCDVQRLLGLYSSAGAKPAYWGAWTGSFPGVTVGTAFGAYDLGQLDLIWLGSARGTTGPYPFCRSFTAGTLDPLRDWLDTGSKLLVLDAGNWPEAILSELGSGVTHEPIGTSTVPTYPSLCAHWLPGQQNPPAVGTCDRFNLNGFIATQSWQSPCVRPWVEPQPHALTTGITASLCAIGISNGTILTSIPIVTPTPGCEIVGRVKGELWPACDAMDYPAIVLIPYSNNPTSHILFCPTATIYVAGLCDGDVTAAKQFSGLSRNGSSLFLQNLWTFRDQL